MKKQEKIIEEIDKLFIWAIDKIPKVQGEYKGENAKKWDERHQAIKVLRKLKPRIKYAINKTLSKQKQEIVENHEIHKVLTPLDVYEKFRIAHSHIKDCLYADNFDKMSDELQNAIETIHGVLYMTESQAIISSNKN